jgi:hypothetical protein
MLITGGPSLYAAVAPSAVTVSTLSQATAWATITNVSNASLSGCSIAPINPPAGTTFAYQTTDPNTNQLTGSKNTPVTIAAGQSQSFVISFLTTQAFNTTEVFFNFSCSGAPPAPNWSGRNTLVLTAQPNLPDMVGWEIPDNPPGSQYATTVGGTLQFNPGLNAVAVVAKDLGFDTNSTVTVTPTIQGKLNLAAGSVAICQTNGAGQCMSGSGVPTASSLNLTVTSQGTYTFTVYLNGPPLCWGSSLYLTPDLVNDVLPITFTYQGTNGPVTVGKMEIALVAVNPSPLPAACPH